MTLLHDGAVNTVCGGGIMKNSTVIDPQGGQFPLSHPSRAVYNPNFAAFRLLSIISPPM